MPILSVRNLNCSYRLGEKNFLVLQDVSFAVDAGEFIAIRGPSGSGKSTLLYALGGLLRPTSGEIKLEQRPFSQLSEAELAFVRGTRIGFIFQQFHLLSKATILENLLLSKVYPIEVRRQGTPADWEAQARQIAQSLGIESQLDKVPNQLSGGQQQRVAIGRALMNQPNLILADEPTGNLDSENARQIITLLKDLHRLGHTVILVTHDEEIAAQADRQILLRDGRIERDTGKLIDSKNQPLERPPEIPELGFTWSKLLRAVFPIVIANILRNKVKSALTMIGVIIGVAAVLTVASLGDYAERRFKEGFRSLGSQNFAIRLSYERFLNWNANVTYFRGFRVPEDIEIIERAFPAIAAISPVARGGNLKLTGQGSASPDRYDAVGANENYIPMQDLVLANGKNITSIHNLDYSPVCVLGADVANVAFPKGAAVIGERLDFSFGTFGASSGTITSCVVRGVLAPVKTAGDWNNPNKWIVFPYLYLKDISGQNTDREADTLMVRTLPDTDVDQTVADVTTFLGRRFGRPSEFRIQTEGKIVEQMNLFLGIFKFLLISVAMTSLGVGGVGIHNLMMASIGERLKEFGLRKALGATPSSLKMQVLLESSTLCCIAGLIGLVIGVVAYEGLLVVGLVFSKQGTFEWLFVPSAFLFSLASVIAVGVFSGLTPARRVEHLEVIDALRSE